MSKIITEQDFYTMVEENEVYTIYEEQNEEERIGATVDYNEEEKIYIVSAGHYGRGFTEYYPHCYTTNKKSAINCAKGLARFDNAHHYKINNVCFF